MNETDQSSSYTSWNQNSTVLLMKILSFSNSVAYLSHDVVGRLLCYITGMYYSENEFFSSNKLTNELWRCISITHLWIMSKSLLLCLKFAFDLMWYHYWFFLERLIGPATIILIFVAYMLCVTRCEIVGSTLKCILKGKRMLNIHYIYVLLHCTHDVTLKTPGCDGLPIVYRIELRILYGKADRQPDILQLFHENNTRYSVTMIYANWSIRWHLMLCIMLKIARMFISRLFVINNIQISVRFHNCDIIKLIINFNMMCNELPTPGAWTALRWDLIPSEQTHFHFKYHTSDLKKKLCVVHISSYSTEINSLFVCTQ